MVRALPENVREELIRKIGRELEGKLKDNAITGKPSKEPIEAMLNENQRKYLKDVLPEGNNMDQPTLTEIKEIIENILQKILTE